MVDLTQSEDAIRRTARHLAETVFAGRAAEIDREERYPWENVEALRDAGLTGMTIPIALGGRGASLLAAVAAVTEIARHCAVSARIVVETNMGALGAILAYGTDAQKRLAADLVLAGDKPAICITEPGAGSAATQMATTARRVAGGYVLDGAKHWITGGGVSRLHLIFARVIEGGRDRGIGAFIALRGAEGLGIGRREPTMGLRGIPETEILLDGLFVADDMVLIPEGDPARGFAKLMTAYNAQRVGAAAVALGIAQGAFGLARDYLREREQFGRPLAEFQGLQWILADMSVALAAAEALVWRAARSAPAGGFPDMTYAAQAKILAAETAVKVTNDALQLHGAAGYSRARPLERMVRDARMFTIGGGTAQVLRTQVASAELGLKLPQTRAARGDAPATPLPVSER
ncbi:acyl-CoA dehydrogenase family protein [Limibaculum sp. M0105]|uniref:3-sulfinopropanoyl-CoA desulfinase n=1 Tax=Thermohalobaculum xanthum TaxID=2753746 RepID=A0A8J7M5Y7_9RHOB|nr:3-sulfinopropanoyl-CoA desulfinase [Thermohalobaculum xanthum]MBK0399146.1 acyl-CoA dehydrogenase family protein [Thermohalobaculum xanthum]